MQQMTKKTTITSCFRLWILIALIIGLLPWESFGFGRDGHNFIQNKYRKPTILDKRVEAHRLRTQLSEGHEVRRSSTVDKHAPAHVKSKLLDQVSFPTHTNRDREHPDHPISMIEGNNFLKNLFSRTSSIGDQTGIDAIDGKISITGRNMPLILLAIEDMAKEKGVTFYEIYKELLNLEDE
jgi:hypothetical protein